MSEDLSQTVRVPVPYRERSQVMIDLMATGKVEDVECRFNGPWKMDTEGNVEPEDGRAVLMVTFR